MTGKKISDHYKVFTNGWIYSKPRNGTSGGFLRQTLDNDGFLRVCLSIKGKRVQRKVHRLIAEAFIDNPSNLPDVLHKNGDLRDNRVDNLVWGKRKNSKSYTWIKRQ